MTSDTSDIRTIQGWDDSSIRAVWDRAVEKKDVKNVPSVNLELRLAPDLSSADLKACFNIVKHTSSSAYKSSSRGWNPTPKKKEMAEPSKMYLLIRADPPSSSSFAPALQSDILAFASFEVDYDDPPYDNRHVVYIYEVHVGEGLRGKGLGKYLLWCIEAMADTNGIDKTMLTVFTSNKGAIAAYRKLGYIKDEASPLDRQVRGRVIMADYMIMSKDWANESGKKSYE